ncbi:MAG: nucleotide exchange factor GrpE, partial [Oscillospiraceae bacterium]|nr:nucleotide exchange factor GrpE [Oscillospiraceae bacterium]
AEVTDDEDMVEEEVVTKKKRSSQTALLKEELATLNDRLLRVMAEYDNYRKRTEKEKQSLISLGTSLAFERFLPVIDTLEMAANADSTDTEYKKGVEMTLSMFSSALKSLGITEIEALNEPFDPQIHNCVATEESDETESGIVIKVLQKGYCYNDRIIRPASVSVSS